MKPKHYQAVVICINAGGDSDAIVVDVPDSFEKCSEEERDFIEKLVKDEGCDYLTHFSTENELDCLSLAANKAKPETSRKVKHWNSAELELSGDIPAFQMDVTDHRQFLGQLYVDMGPVDGNIDDNLSVGFEISAMPDGTHVQAMNIALDNGDSMMSAYKRGQQLVLEPNGRLTMDEVELEPNRRAYIIKVEG
jgi:hypothetical protein